MTSARSTGGGPWMASNSSTTVRLSASIPGLEDDPRWRPTTSCPSPTANEQSLMKDGLPPGSSFSKGMLDDEWYIPPDNSLMDEMKELSYSSSLAASQQSEDVAPSAHFNLDSPHLQSFLSRNTTTTRPSFNGLDGRSNLSTFLDGPGGLSFDGSGGNNTLMSNFRSTSGLAGLGGGNVLLDTQNGTSNAGSLGNLLTPGLGSRGCVSNGLLLSNLSPRNGVTGAPFNNDGDGGGGLNAHHHHHHSLSGNLSSILTSGISNSFSNSGRISPLGHNSPYNSSSNTPRGLAAAPNTVLGNGCTTFASKRDGGFSNAMNLGSRNVLGGGGKDNNSLLLQSRAILPQLEGTTATTSSQAATGGGASAGGPATGGGAGTQQQQQQQHQTLFQKRAALRHSLSGEGMASPTIKSPTQVVTSGSNDSPVDMPDEESPNMTVDTTITTTPTAVTPTQTHNNNKSGDSSSKKARNNGSSNNSSKATVPSTEDGGGGSRRPPQPPPAPQQPSGSDEVGGDYGLDDDQRLGPDDGKDDEDDMDESGDGSGVLYETDDTLAMDGGGAGGGAAGGSQGGLAHGGAGASGEKGKGKKGLPAKNLMAERRRRKKLNDRLYLLRSVVPKITKMDRASILGDAIEYLKELLQRINDLHTELESAPAERPLPPLSPAPLPPPTPSLACRVKEETPHSLPSPDPQPARVEVRTREGRALNIHMFCQRKPGLLLSTMRALDGLGLDVQQAVISCFNGFALDVFKAEQSKETEVGPEEIRAVLLHAAGSSHNTAQ